MERKDIIEIFHTVVGMLEELGYEASVYEDYSGRGMFGSLCDGIVTDASGILVGYCICGAAKDWGEDNRREINDEEIVDILPTRMDSLGTDTIYY